MAAGRIKGITIEIGGDSTPLQKALSGVDKSIRDTQANLKDIDKLLKLDPSNTELLTQKQKALKDAIGLTKDRLNELKSAQSNVKEGTAEWDGLQREIADTEQKLKGLQGQYKEFGSVASQQLKAVGDKITEAGKKVSDFGQKLAPISGGAAAIGGSMLKMGYDAITSADELNTLSKQTGISTEELQKMQYAADLVDVSVDDITGALRKMKSKMDPSNEAFKKLGVSVQNSDGSMRSATSVFYDTIGALSKIENETERDQAAMELFGKGADSLAGIIDDGGAALRAYGDEAESMGLILSEDTINSLNETNDTIDKVKGNIAGTMGQIGADVGTVLAPLLEQAAELIGNITARLRELTPEQTETILKIVGIVAAIAPVLIIGGKLISGIGSMISMIGSVVGVLGGPLTLAIAAIIAIGVLLYKNWDTVKEYAQKLKDGLLKAWDAIKTGITKAVESIKNFVTNTWNNIKNTVTNVTEGMKNMLSGKLDAIKKKYEEAGGGIQGIMSAAWEGIKQYFTLGFDTINTLTGGKLDAIKEKFTSIFDKIKDTVKNAIDKIKGLFNFNWSLPSIKLPHFSWDWINIGGLIDIPRISVQWYKKAYDNPMLFTSPTVIGGRGFGDGGGSGEIVYGRDQLMRDIAEASQGEITINVYASEGMNVKQLAREVSNELTLAERQRARAYA